MGIYVTSEGGYKIHLRKIRRTRLEKIYSTGIPGHDWQDLSITTLSPRDRKPIRKSYKYCAQVKERYAFHPLTKPHLESLTYLSVGVPSQVPSPARPKETPRRNDRLKKRKIDTSAIILHQPTVPGPSLHVQITLVIIGA